MQTFKLACTLVLACSLSLYARGFKIIKPEKVTAPAGFVEDASKRGLYHKMFKNQVDTTKRVAIIGVEPLHYADSLGVLREFNFYESADTASEYTNAVQVGRFRVEYTPTGKLRFLRRKGMIEFTPAFDTTQVGVEFVINHNGLKANYILDDASAPTHLAWGYDYSSTFEKEGAKGKGKVKDNAGVIRAEMQEMVGWDANRNPVTLTVNYTADSLLVDVLTSGATFPITIDPSIVDSANVLNTTWSFLGLRSTAADWTTARNATTAAGRWNGISSSTTTNERYFTSYPLTDIIVGSVDSVIVVFTLNSTSGTLWSVPVKGTWTGSDTVGSASWYNDLDGWQASGSYAGNVTIVGDSTDWGSASAKRVKFNSTGNDWVKTVANQTNDTLRVAWISMGDYRGSTPGTAYGGVDASTPKRIYLFYVEGSLSVPGITTLANMDTLKVNGQAIWFSTVGKVDSTGGTIDSVGVRYMKKGLSLSTNGVVKKKAQAGLSDADTFFVALASADSLTKDTLYVYQVAAHSAGGWSYSATYDTISTYFGPPTLTTTANPTTYGVPYVYASLSMDVPALGTVTGTYAPAAQVGADSLILRGFRYWLAGSEDSVEWNWISSGKGGAVPYSLSTDTLLLDSTYTFTAYAKGSLGSKTWASDSQTIDLTGSQAVGISAPTYSLSTVTVQFTASIDSGASVLPATKRGFFAWTRVADSTGTDTIRVESSASGGFPYGNYSLPLSCPTDTVLLWRAYAVNAVDTTFGALDSVRTYLAGLTSSLVVGGTDTVQTIIYVGSSGGSGVAGRKPGKFEGR